MPRALSAVLIELSDAISGTDSLQDIYAAALRGIVSITGIPRASILLFDEDGVMRFKAWEGLSPEYRAVVEGHSPWKPGAAACDPLEVNIEGDFNVRGNIKTTVRASYKKGER